jgi:hypothetical protein
VTGEELVDRLRRDRRQHPHAGRREYSQAARALADVCERLIDAGQATQAVPVLRKAVDRMTQALMYMDDSSGAIGHDLRQIMSLYARACAAAPPKPAALAKWLVGLACDGPGWPRVLLRDFADALGERGLAEVARLVETPTSTNRDLREQLAELSGDVDRHVAVLAEHLKSPEQYGRIALVLRDAGRRREAIVWARRGLEDSWFADSLLDVLADLLLADGQPDAAIRVRRDSFARHPSADAYQALAAVSADDSATWALAVLRERLAQKPAYAFELVEVLGLLGQHDEAWRVGREHRNALRDEQWLTVLGQRGAGHPADVLAPYAELIEHHILNSSGKNRYRRAVGLLPALRDAYAKSGDSGGFRAYLEGLRARHALRPAFIRALDTSGHS